MDNSNNKQNDNHPPSDWSDQENFWNGKTYEKTRSHKLRYRHFSLPKRESQDSNWNENLYPHCYRAKVQSQVPPRQPPLGWPNWKRNEIPLQNKNKPDRKSEGNQVLIDNKDPKSSGAF